MVGNPFDFFTGGGQPPGMDVPPEAPQTTQPDANTLRWKEYLSNPMTQAALFNVGIGLMQPKWNPQAVIPDALSAGAQTVSAGQTYDDKQALEQQRFAETAANRAEDRASREQLGRESIASREEIARISAQSRQDVAASRVGDRMGQIEFGKFMQAKKDYIDQQYKSFRANLGNMSAEPTPEMKAQWEFEAHEYGKRSVEQARATVGGQGGSNSQQPTTRQNLPNIPGPQGGAAIPGPQATTSGNAAAPKPEARAYLNTLRQLMPGFDPSNLTDQQKMEIFQRVRNPRDLPWIQEGFWREGG